MSAYAEIKNKLKACNQEHLLRFWNELTVEEQKAFIVQLNTIDFNEVNNLFERAQASATQDLQKLDGRMEPIPPELFESEKGVEPAMVEEYQRAGFQEISHGHVAVVLMAGGQGTRLGVSYPKGMYSVGLPSGKTLFQIQAERIRKLSELAEEHTGIKSRICWYLMTSGPTYETTNKYMKDNNYFGLNSEDVKLFQQGLLPCFDFNGKILLDGKNNVALSPDGNGGIYRALAENGILDDMNKKGIKFVHVHSVDNILVKVADPVFIGYCVKKQADCGAKVVSKNGPDEAVGVVCQVDGRFQVVEYSEITDKTANLRDSSGELIFRAGNICNHFFTTEYLREIANKYEQLLKLHVAKKKIPYVNDQGEKIKPKEPNGMKIEKFVFDVFEFAPKFVTWEVPRTSEFSALKNADSAQKDCPSTSRRDLLQLHKSYIEKAGGKLATNIPVEISPLLSYAGENLVSKINGKIFEKCTILAADGEKYSEEKHEIMFYKN